jgi:hypothetical protein
MCPVRNMYTTTGDASVPTKRARFSNGLAKYPPVKANPPTLHENTTPETLDTVDTLVTLSHLDSNIADTSETLETLETLETPETLETVSYLD